MRIELPKSDLHSSLRLLIKTPTAIIQHVYDDTHKFAEVVLPEGVLIECCGIEARFLTSAGADDPNFSPVTIQKASEQKSTPRKKQHVANDSGSVRGDVDGGVEKPDVDEMLSVG